MDNLILLSNVPFQVTGTSTDATCANLTDGTISLTVSGGISPYTFSWSGPNGFSSTSQNLTNIGAGTYTVIVNDNGGHSASLTFYINLGNPVPLDTCIWLGTYNNDWFYRCNWLNDYVPDSTCHALIPGQTPNNPSIIGDTAICKSLIIKVDNGGSLFIDKVNNGGLIDYQ